MVLCLLFCTSVLLLEVLYVYAFAIYKTLSLLDKYHKHQAEDDTKTQTEL